MLADLCPFSSIAHKITPRSCFARGLDCAKFLLHPALFPNLAGTLESEPSQLVSISGGRGTARYRCGTFNAHGARAGGGRVMNFMMMKIF